MIMVQLHSYDDVAKHFKSARNKTKGKAVGTWGRIYEDWSGYVLAVKGTPLFRFYADNTVEVIASLDDIESRSLTMGQALHRKVGLSWVKISSGNYRLRVRSAECADKYWYYGNKGQDWNVYRVYKGLKVSLTTGKALNPIDISKATEIPEVRKQWLKDLKAFKLHVKTCAKLGVIDKLIATEASKFQSREVQLSAKYVNWDSGEALNRLSYEIKEQRASPELMSQLIRTITKYRTHRGAQELETKRVVTLMTDELNRLLKRHSQRIRLMYGVYGEYKED